MPALTAIQREHGWLPRESLVVLARDMPAAVRDRGARLLLPALRTSPPEGTEVAVCRDHLLPLSRDNVEVPEGA
jgi:NADH:ubiquinone oxidoreductase subunit E